MLFRSVSQSRYMHIALLNIRCNHTALTNKQLLYNIKQYAYIDDGGRQDMGNDIGRGKKAFRLGVGNVQSVNTRDGTPGLRFSVYLVDDYGERYLEVPGWRVMHGKIYSPSTKTAAGAYIPTAKLETAAAVEYVSRLAEAMFRERFPEVRWPHEARDTDEGG